MFTTTELKRALTSKGFREIEGSSHTKFILFVDGLAQSVWTVVSRGKSDIPASLQSNIARQLRMPGAAYLRRFVDCSVNAEEYTEMLRGRGVVD